MYNISNKHYKQLKGVYIMPKKPDRTPEGMERKRDYINKTYNKKYINMNFRIDAELHGKFVEKLTQEGKTQRGFIIEKINEYLKE